MIKNIIFDMGGVLVDYTPKAHLKALGFDDEQTEALFEMIFNAPTWQELDRGTYTYQEAVALYSQAHPDYAEAISRTMTSGFEHMLHVKEDTADFLKQLKGEGYHIYVLSNFSVEGYEYILPRFDYLNYVDEKIISGIVKKIKPNRDIYEHMLATLAIEPTESLFIDDLKENLAPAAALGIHTVLFTTLDEVKEKVRALLNER